MDLQRFNDKYIGIRSDIKQNKRTVYRKIETIIMEEKIIKIGVILWTRKVKNI